MFRRKKIKTSYGMSYLLPKQTSIKILSDSVNKFDVHAHFSAERPEIQQTEYIKKSSSMFFISDVQNVHEKCLSSIGKK